MWCYGFTSLSVVYWFCLRTHTCSYFYLIVHNMVLSALQLHFVFSNSKYFFKTFHDKQMSGTLSPYMARLWRVARFYSLKTQFTSLAIYGLSVPDICLSWNVLKKYLLLLNTKWSWSADNTILCTIK
jgi:hypothetical protein